EAAATKPFGFQPFWPGIGPGGHCIPVDPYYLSWKAREFDFQTKFIELAADTNLQMAPYTRQRIFEFLNRRGRMLRGARVLALGASFKQGVGDVRNSRAVRVIELLEDAGATVDIVDPHVDEVRVSGEVRDTVALEDVSFEDYDLVTVLVRSTVWPVERVVASGVLVFDAVNATGGVATGNVERL
ncbi:MAG TPA: UDP binding domain-containing protein, partial [Acidimicrobiales bacterium]